MRSLGASAPASHPTRRSRARSRYRDNLARHLIGISRDLQSRVMHRLLEERRYRGLRPSLGPLMSLLWIEGRPLTAIASQLAISKQACSQLANLAEAAGYLERKPDPKDRRAKLVMLTARGRKLVEHAVEVILERDSEYAEIVGPASYRRFTSSLAALFQGLGIPTHADPALTATASRSVGVLPLIVVRLQRSLMEAIHERGHTGLKVSHGQVLPLIGTHGARIHEIARIRRVSRQSVSATSADLAELGYLRREPDPSDRRGVVLHLTERGTRLVDDSIAALDRLERSFRDILGESRLHHLQRVARELNLALRLEQEVSSSGHDVERLATKLRRQLGSRDTARLAELLEGREH